MFYGAIHGPRGDAPNGCIWTRQFVTPLTWVRAFLKGSNGELERRFTLDAYLNKGEHITVTTDASPWGLGAVLEIGGVITSYFADAVSEVDKKVLSLAADGSSKDQQALEALVILVALREWAPVWTDRRVQISVRSDNTAALSMVCKMQPHSDQMGIIARELALDIGQSSVAPDECQHIAGIANTAADHLSRMYEPGRAKALPSYLEKVPRHQCSPRLHSWWRSVPPR